MKKEKGLAVCVCDPEALECPYTVGGRGVTPPWTPPPKIKVTIVGKNEIYHWENLVGPFLVPPPPPCASAALSKHQDPV